MIQLLGTLKLHVELSRPGYASGGAESFLRSILDELVGILAEARTSGMGILEVISAYYLRRAKLCCMVWKHPNIEDFKQCLVEHQEKQFVGLQKL